MVTDFEKNNGKSLFVKRLLLERPVQELMVIYLPHVVIPTVTVFISAYPFDVTMKFLIYSSMTESIQKITTFAPFLVEEYVYMNFLATIYTTTLQINLIMFLKVNESLNSLR